VNTSEIVDVINLRRISYLVVISGNELITEINGKSDNWHRGFAAFQDAIEK
jgi:hypothetical protein